MTVLRTGSNSKYSDGWENVFGKKKKSSKKTTPSAKKKTRASKTSRSKKRS